MSRVLTVAIGLSCLSVPASAAANEAEENAIKQIMKLGGAVTRDDSAEGKPAVEVFLGARTATEPGLKAIGSLVHLKSLHLGLSKVTDSGLKHLTGLQKLRALDLGNNKITDAGLKELAALKQLQALDLRGTAVTDLGLKQLTALKQLQTLNLSDTKVTNAGIESFQKAMPNCEVLR